MAAGWPRGQPRTLFRPCHRKTAKCGPQPPKSAIESHLRFAESFRVHGPTSTSEFAAVLTPPPRNNSLRYTLRLGEGTPALGEESAALGEETARLGEAAPRLGERTPKLGERTPPLGEQTTKPWEETPFLPSETTILTSETPFQSAQKALFCPQTRGFPRKPGISRPHPTHPA